MRVSRKDNKKDISWCVHLTNALAQPSFCALPCACDACMAAREVRAPQLQERNSTSVIWGRVEVRAPQLQVRMAAHAMRAPQFQARNSTSVICGARMTALEVRAPQFSSAYTARAVRTPQLRCVWQLAQCAHFNFRHVIPLLSSVARA